MNFDRNDKIIEECARNLVHKCRSSDLGDRIFRNNFVQHDTVLRAMDPTKSPGPDGIHGRMLLHLGPNGQLRLLNIFNQSWKRGRIPLDWKRATVIPIRKADKTAGSPESYRPISLTSLPCKLME